MAEAGTTSDLDCARTQLVLAGQIEQGLTDANIATDAAQQLTDEAADAFVDVFGSVVGSTNKLKLALENLADEVAGDQELEIRVPEGFVFYQLYPESYILSVRRWSQRLPSSSCCVVGIRSIGTTLSAILLAELRRLGFSAQRMTVRPTGHPFDRECDLAIQSNPSDYCLIVDEGPGLSGSSMASVAEAATRAGFDPERIVFFPGHRNRPGEMASVKARHWWKATPIFATNAEELRWEGRSMEEVLLQETGRALGTPIHGASVQNLSGGLWRPYLFQDPNQWPATTPTLEQPKYLVKMPDGLGVLWRFTGFAPTSGCADPNWHPKIVDHKLGFTAEEWIEGSREPNCTAEEVVRYICDMMGAPLTLEEIAEGTRRLAEMVKVNSIEALGDAHDLPIPNRGEPLRRYGDGRMAPHKWIRTPAGNLVKTDHAGHDRDHTCVGAQPFTWDVAGAIVEGLLSGDCLIDAIESRGIIVPRDLLDFHIAAYAAIQLGRLSLVREEQKDSATESARARYRSFLSRPSVLQGLS